MLDQIRDVVLHKKGNETLILTGNHMGETQNGSTDLAKFIDDLTSSQSNRLGGMLLKTYDSDIFNNWIKTDWIDGAEGITEITSIDITANDGKLTMDALNLQRCSISNSAWSWTSHPSNHSWGISRHANRCQSWRCDVRYGDNRQ